MNVIEVRGVTKKFGNFTALNNIDLSVGGGEIYGFIGPNGAGKSTTIRILLGMLKATSGEATIFGKDVWKEAVEIHKRIAYVPGDVNLWPNLTGGEVIDVLMKLRGNGDAKKRDELLERFNLDPTKKCRAYSKGNRQKVALVAAFAQDADLFIFDEPTSGLDPLMERVFQEYVREKRNEGKTIFLSSHILSEVEKLCDKVAIIRQGKIIEEGTLTDMRHLTRTNIIVQTKQPLEGIRDMKGIHQVEEKDGQWRFQVDGTELDAVIRHISQFGIVRFESLPPTLEDLFMGYYEGADLSETSRGNRL
ncbi:ABC transporter ATP-binding protein [Fervidibacillus albus]|uniref:ABC transporter ATP-binding protein n=1 Tax=Fervidibacillus albus TaxID=2980026 RepID=A0A9E8RWS6_9BACI|nr:ABC transporter ATP-binding protein [Fervidibacillus albus]WAA10996.1 ABC transporter ATP-binding protein [Fervidibacillus albus]